jgi:hypothetical protein
MNARAMSSVPGSGWVSRMAQPTRYRVMVLTSSEPLISNTLMEHYDNFNLIRVYPREIRRPKMCLNVKILPEC